MVASWRHPLNPRLTFSASNVYIQDALVAISGA
jgi:hypothetical protein